MGMKRWAVVVTAHEVRWRGYPTRPADGPSYAVPRVEGIYPADDPTTARRYGIEAAHREGRVPPFRSLLRQSSRFATATRYMDDDDRDLRRIVKP